MQGWNHGGLLSTSTMVTKMVVVAVDDVFSPSEIGPSFSEKKKKGKQNKSQIKPWETDRVILFQWVGRMSCVTHMNRQHKLDIFDFVIVENCINNDFRGSRWLQPKVILQI